MARAAVDRFQAKVRRDPSGCWQWVAATNGKGYGRFYAGSGRGLVYAHRWSYEHHVGPIPDGMTIDHLCRNRGCVNPRHLQPVTVAENLRRGDGARVTRARHRATTRCKHGHPFDHENTYLRADGHRACRACGRERKRRRAT